MDLAMVKIQPLRRRSVFRLRNGNKHMVGGFSVLKVTTLSEDG